MKTYELDSVELHKDTLRYVDIGDGPPVILVHGLLGSHMSWAGQIERLSRLTDLLLATRSDQRVLTSMRARIILTSVRSVHRRSTQAGHCPN